MHGKLRVADGSLGDLRATHFRTDERSIPAARSQTKLQFSFVELSLP